jgi:hypothetical protein
MAKQRKFYWWHGKDLKQLLADIETMGGPDAVRVEFHPAEGLLRLRPEELDETAVRAQAGYNFVHTNPPDE